MALNRRISFLGVTILMTALAAGLIALITFGGGGRPTMASRSAAAFREAQRRGAPVAESTHGHGALSPGGASGGHAAGHQPPATRPEGEHAEHGEAALPERGEAAVPGHGEHATTRSDPPGGSPHAGMQHGTGAPGRRPGSSQPPIESSTGHAGHGVMPQVPAGTPGGAPPAAPVEKAAVARSGQPAATLAPDYLDAPAATSERDAKRSTELAAQMESGGHGAHGAGSYRQLDAGRESAPIEQEKSMTHQHGTSPGSPPLPAPTPEMKKRPRAATPIPTPGGHVHPGGGRR